jgi:cold-inducible RNA-binding protein
LSKKLYVGNLSYETTEAQVRDMISEFGTIESLNMITDKSSGDFRGFCFVEMEQSAANAAINGLNGKDVDGRALKVNEAKPREERGGGNRNGGGKFPHSGGRR